MSASAKTDSTIYRSRVLDAETHLVDIEGCLATLAILDDGNFGPPSQENEALGYLINLLHRHTNALRKTLFPNERLNRQVAT